jgi:hypothetical protein
MEGVVIYLITMGGVFALVFYVRMQQKNRLLKNMEGAASKLGLAFHETDGIAGSSKSGLELSIQSRAQGKSRIYVLQMKYSYTMQDRFRFSIKQENIGTTLGKAFGTQDVLMG